MTTSKMVLHRRQSAIQVINAARRHVGRVGVGVAEMLGPESGRAAEVLMEAWANKLERVTLDMVTMDEVESDLESAVDADARAQRDEAAAELRGVLLGLRDLSSIMFGAEFIRSLGFVGTVSEDPALVRRLGNRVLGKIDETDRPSSRVDGMMFDPRPWKQRISAPLTRLNIALDRLTVVSLEKEHSVGARHRAIAVHDAVLQKSGVLLSALLSVAGEEEVALRVQTASSIPAPAFDSTAMDASREISVRDTLPTEIRQKGGRISKWFGTN